MAEFENAVSVSDEASAVSVTEGAQDMPCVVIDEVISGEASLLKSPKNYLMAVAHEEMNPRRRSTMEDVHRMINNLLMDENETYSYFGVYDGHGGRPIAEFLEHALEDSIASELRQADDASVVEKISRAFLITDMESRRLNITTSGATAVVALLAKTDGNDRRLYVANVGDSRAVLVCEQSLERLVLIPIRFL
jgi:serine/threonine protein phosphatase PrpC